MAHILLIGTSHLDLEKGPAKLRKRLDQFCPEVVLVEGSAELENAQNVYRVATERVVARIGFEKEVGEAIIFEQRSKQWEKKTAREYCDVSGARYDYLNDNFPQIPIDQIEGRVAQGLEAFARKTVSEQRKLAETIKGLADGAFNLFKPFMDSPEEKEFTTLLPNHERNVGARDAVMRMRIDEVLGQDDVACLATVTGFAHLIRNPREDSLYCRCADLNPTRDILFE